MNFPLENVAFSGYAVNSQGKSNCANTTYSHIEENRLKQTNFKTTKNEKCTNGKLVYSCAIYVALCIIVLLFVFISFDACVHLRMLSWTNHNGREFQKKWDILNAILAAISSLAVGGSLCPLLIKIAEYMQHEQH